MAKNKMKICKHCGAEIAKSAKVCPQCGGKNKKPIFKRVWFWILVILLVLFGMMVAGSGNQYKLSSDATELSEKDFKAACKEVDYKDLLRNAEEMKGSKIAIKGRVNQVVYESEEGTSESQYKVATGYDELSEDYFDDDIILYFKRGDMSKIIEDDTLMIYGEISGTETYTTVLGEKVTVPVVTGVYVEMQ